MRKKCYHFFGGLLNAQANWLNKMSEKGYRLYFDFRYRIFIRPSADSAVDDGDFFGNFRNSRRLAALLNAQANILKECAEKIKRHNLKNLKCLIVDDNANMRSLLRTILTSLGMRCKNRQRQKPVQNSDLWQEIFHLKRTHRIIWH